MQTREWNKLDFVQCLNNIRCSALAFNTLKLCAWDVGVQDYDAAQFLFKANILVLEEYG